MNSSENPTGVWHHVAASRFEVEVDGLLAVAEYVKSADQMTMTHTHVPPELRGRGLAEKLVRAALEHARAEKLRLVPACSYVATFIKRHPEYQALVS
jgi:predicted GNAT family acetyltransferase